MQADDINTREDVGICKLHFTTALTLVLMAHDGADLWDIVFKNPASNSILVCSSSLYAEAGFEVWHKLVKEI